MTSRHVISNMYVDIIKAADLGCVIGVQKNWFKILTYLWKNARKPHAAGGVIFLLTLYNRTIVF